MFQMTKPRPMMRVAMIPYHIQENNARCTKETSCTRYDHLASPLTCLRLREFGVGGTEGGVAFSSFLGDTNMDCLDALPVVVRGNLLFARLLPGLSKPGLIFAAPLPSRLVGLKGMGPLIDGRGRASLSGPK